MAVMDLFRPGRRKYQLLGVFSVALLISLYLYLSYTWTANTSQRVRTPGLRAEYKNVFSAHATNNTVVILPVNTGMLNWVDNLLCSLKSTPFDPTQIVFWTLDLDAQATLNGKGYATYHDPDLYSTSNNENAHGDTGAYKRMMKERPKFYIDVLSSGFDMLMLDADTVFWQSPHSIMPGVDDPPVDIVYSTDAREFYQTHNAFLDDRRRGPYIPPICNGIFWMKSSPATISLWKEMLDIFNSPWSSIFNTQFNDDQRGMDVLLNDGRAQLVEPFPGGIQSDTVPESPQFKSELALNVRILDQTKVVNGQLLLNRHEAYAEHVVELEGKGQQRIAAHFNWNTKKVSKQDGARQVGMIFVDNEGNCIPSTEH